MLVSMLDRQHGLPGLPRELIIRWSLTISLKSKTSFVLWNLQCLHVSLELCFFLVNKDLEASDQSELIRGQTAFLKGIVVISLAFISLS